MAIPPGWYADPDLRAQRRYWDGAHWTSHVRATDVVGPFVEPSSADDEERDRQAVPGQDALTRRTRARRTGTGILLVSVGAALLVASVALTQTAAHFGIVAVVSGAVLLFTAALGRARSLRVSSPTSPHGAADTVVLPSRRVYRGMLVASIPAFVLLAGATVAVASVGEFGGAVLLGSLAVFFAVFTWFGWWGLSRRNRFVADGWGVRFGRPLGISAFSWDQVQGFGEVPRGAAVRIGYWLTNPASARPPAPQERSPDGLLPPGYQPEDAAAFNMLLSEHRSGSPGERAGRP